MPRYDFAHPKFRNGMVTFDVKKPDLLYEFRQAAIRRRYVLRSDMYLYSPSGERVAKVQNYFDVLVITKPDDIGSTKIRSKQNIEEFFNSLDECVDYRGGYGMKLDEARRILKENGFICEG